MHHNLASTLACLRLLPLLTALALTLLPLHADNENDQAALRSMKSAYEEAVNSGHPEKIANHLAENVTAVMVTGEEVQGTAGLDAYWKKVREMIGEGGTYQVEVLTDKTEFAGDSAFSRGRTHERVVLANGKTFKFDALWSTVCQKQEGEWKVVRMHSTIDPINNPFVVARLTATKWTYGLLGLILGSVTALVGTLLICRLSKR